MNVLTKHGLEPIDESQVNQAIQEACEGLDKVNWADVAQKCQVTWYDGISTDELAEVTILSAASLIENHPNYEFVAARLLLRKIYKNRSSTSMSESNLYHQNLFFTFDESILINIVPERDKLFRYRGLRRLSDSYLLKDKDGKYLETPQSFWMRVAMGIALSEDTNHIEWAIKFYDVMSQFLYIPSTPTLFNAGLKRPQMASCYVNHVEDSLEGIFDAYANIAQIAKYSGGVGTNWSHVRGSGAEIRGTNGQSTGLVPWLKIQNDIALAVNQGGKRPGSHCAYIEPWHIDVEQFIDLRKPVGDERRRTPDLDTALWIPDLFMKKVEADEDWYLFDPSEVPVLCETWGEEFESHYQVGIDLQVYKKKMKARDLYKKILSSLYETGHPWITFKDTCNRDNPMSKLGMIRSSNLCTEITLNTGPGETAVCNLGSINLENHISFENGWKGIDFQKLRGTTRLAIRMLDNVITGNWYPTEESKDTNTANRPLGIGLMGMQVVRYAFPQRKDFLIIQDILMDEIKSEAVRSSNSLAKERGEFPNYKQSKGFAGIMRNSHLLAIAPTATISDIVGTAPSIEPMFSNLYTAENSSGVFTVINRWLVKDFEECGLWDDQMILDLKINGGSVQNIDRVPPSLKKKYRTAFEIDPFKLVDEAVDRQKYICQSQSLNLYVGSPNGKLLYDLYMYAWKNGIKTTYYLRTKGASTVEKSTIDPNKYGKTHITPTCNVTDPTCTSCQ